MKIMSNIMASRKIVWPAAILLVGIYFFPSILNFVHRATASVPHTTPLPPIEKPKPHPPDVQPVTTTASPALEEAAVMQALPGVWVGQSLVHSRGLCTINFTIQPAKNPGEFTGYSTLACAYTPLIPGLAKPNSMAEVGDFMRPVSSFLTGKQVNGALEFHVDKTLGDKCPPTSFTLTPFSAQLAAEWQDAACGGGHIIMARTK
jgi:hypothetical protein